MISCILLSAGLSSRFGSPKALASFNGQTVIEQLLKMFVSLKFQEIVVVLGAYAKEVEPVLLKHKKIKVVYNKDYILGQTSSFKVGLQNISSQSRGVVLFPVDYPVIQKKTLEDLLGCFLKNHPLILVPTFHGRKGHPPFFAVQLKEEFLTLDHSLGVNTIIHQHLSETLFFPVSDEGVVLSFNTPEEWRVIRKYIPG